VYVIASIGCAVTGAVVYMNLLRIQPDAAFGVDWTARMIFIVIIGGLGSIEGPVIGALIYFGLRQGLSDYGSAYLIILGVVAVIVTMFVPRGIGGQSQSRWPINLFGIQRRLIEPRSSGPGGPGRS
jgi:branched-chain amino acid transport system permease protein